MELKEIFKKKISGMIAAARSLFKNDFIVGLDFGASSIKMAQFRRGEDGLSLVTAGLKEIKEEKEIVSALRGLIEGIDVRESQFIVSVNCPQTAIKKIRAPYMPKNELRAAIILEAMNYFPFSIENSLLDFEILGEIVERGVKKYEVIVAVSPRKTVDKYLAMLAAAGIKPSSFIPGAYALKIAAGRSLDRNTAACFIDLGHSSTELIIVRGNVVEFSRKIPISGRDFTSAMTTALLSDRGKTQLSLEEAEKIKRREGIPKVGETRIVDDKISTGQILSMVRAPLEHLANEMERCFDYYREETGAGKIDSLTLFGGSASLKGIVEFFYAELGIEIKIGNPLANFKIEPEFSTDKEKEFFCLAAAVGAGLSEKGGLNLLPLELKDKNKRFFKRTTIQSIAASGILILAFIYIGMMIQFTNFQKRISTANMEFAGLWPQIKEFSDQSLTAAILADEPYWEDVFKELSNVVPSDMYFKSFSKQGKIIEIRGEVISFDADRILSNFILALNKGVFKDVKLVSSRDLEDDRGNEFEIKCAIE